MRTPVSISSTSASALRSERRSRRWASLALALGAIASARAAGDPADRAAARVFPPPLALERGSVELTAEQSARIRADAGTAPPSSRVESFVAREPSGSPAGYAYVDRHLVRTLEETLLVALDPAARVLRVEVLEFDEPPEYQPSERWFQQFEGRTLSPELRLKRGIRTLAGATLSSHAATDAVRRVLALHRVLHPGTEPAR
jgi:FMN-binding domain